jgi:hypothetical protein
MKRKLIWFIVILTAINFLTGHFAKAAEQPKKPIQKAAGGGPITLEVLNPRGEIPPITVTGIVARVRDLDGKKIGLVDNGKAGADYFLDATEELLKKKFPSATILRFRKSEGTINPAPKMYSAVAEKCDAFIYATGD